MSKWVPWVVGIVAAILATVLLWGPIAGAIFVVGWLAWANMVYMLIIYSKCFVLGLAVHLWFFVREMNND